TLRLIFTCLKKLYDRLGSYYLSNPAARDVALRFYRQLLETCEPGQREQLPVVIRHYGRDSAQSGPERPKPRPPPGPAAA
ncbi:hypothetical protein NPN23_24620, partial [Vibrio parahaemolyticus]|nr:hypothetical protein [Vibrio parahaemolyticus]